MIHGTSDFNEFSIFHEINLLLSVSLCLVQTVQHDLLHAGGSAEDDEQGRVAGPEETRHAHCGWQPCGAARHSWPHCAQYSELGGRS